MKKETAKTILKIIIALSILGIITSLYLLYDHYATGASVCDINTTVSCSLVNSSVFSELFNVPVALLGALWFIFVIIFSWNLLRDKHYKLLPVLLGWSIVGILSIIYFIIAEIILRAICPFCTVVHVLTVIILILVVILYRDQKINMKNIVTIARPWIIVIGIVFLLPFVLFNFSFSSGENYDDVAKCLTNKGVNMYGSFRCGVCAKTRSMFGDSFQYINEIECHPQGENPQTELCVEKNIEGTPTWILEPQGEEIKRHTGFLSIEELKEFAGCQ